MATDLSKLRVFQVLKDEKTYDSALKNRLQRLENWKTKAKTRKDQRDFEKCVALTKECHIIATSLQKVMAQLIKAFPTDSTQAIDRVIAFQDKSVQDSKEIKKLSKYPEMLRAIQAKQKEHTLKSKEILMEAVSSKSSNSENMAEFIEEKISHYDELDKNFLQIDIALLYTN